MKKLVKCSVENLDNGKKGNNRIWNERVRERGAVKFGIGFFRLPFLIN